MIMSSINLFKKYPISSEAIMHHYPDNTVYSANMGPTWVLSDPDGPHVGPMNLATRVSIIHCTT